MKTRGVNPRFPSSFVPFVVKNSELKIEKGEDSPQRRRGAEEGFYKLFNPKYLNLNFCITHCVRPS